MKYQKRYISESDFLWEQVYDNDYIRIVSADRPALLHWLAEGNTPEEIPYTPPALPDLVIYKEQKKQEVSAAAKQTIQSLTVYRIPDNPENLTPELQTTFLARAVFPILAGSDLPENERLYLLSVYGQIAAIQQDETVKHAAINNAATHAEVDNIVLN